MPLTVEESRFLDAYVYEVTHGPPFGGPAARSLSQKGIAYLHLCWFLTAYQRELSAEGKPAAGNHNPDPPPNPWESLQRVQERCQALRAELDSRNMEPQGSGAAPKFPERQFGEV